MSKKKSSGGFLARLLSGLRGVFRGSELLLRENVAGILRRPGGEILVCERVNNPGSWQFPQGGVDDGETLEQALVRELWEETGVERGDYTIGERRGPYRYLFSEPKKGHHGKVQHYFLCEFMGEDSRINIETEHPEFRAWQWIRPADFEIGWLPPMKHDVYRRVFADFFGLKMRGDGESR